MHDYSSDANIGYKDINAQLDKYTRAFDVIDILYQTLRTSLNVYNTYETVSDRIGDYKDMLEDFNKKILVLSSINQSLDNIKKHLNKAYFDTWKYIQVRIGYWKRQVYRAKTKQEIKNRRLSKVLLEDGKELATSDISS